MKKYVVCLDKISTVVNRLKPALIRKDIKVIKAMEPTVMLDAVVKMIASDMHVDPISLVRSHMDTDWTHHNVPNSDTIGACKISQTGVSDWYIIAYYRAIRDADVITLKEE